MTAIYVEEMCDFTIMAKIENTAVKTNLFYKKKANAEIGMEFRDVYGEQRPRHELLNIR